MFGGTYCLHSQCRTCKCQILCENHSEVSDASVFVFHDSTAFFFSQIIMFKPPRMSSIVSFEIFYELWEDFSSVDRQQGVQILGKPALSVCEHANNPEFKFHEDRKHRCSSLHLFYHQELEAARVTLQVLLISNWIVTDMLFIWNQAICIWTNIKFSLPVLMDTTFRVTGATDFTVKSWCQCFHLFWGHFVPGKILINCNHWVLRIVL
jgi:hypothetical protein